MPDEETLPYLTGLAMDGGYRVYNFALPGYGPHQMLAAIEAGIVQESVAGRPRQVIYQALSGHPARAAGAVSYGGYGPRFLLDGQGEVRRAGRLGSPEGGDGKGWGVLEALLRRAEAQLYKSEIIRALGTKQKDTEDQIALMVGILVTSRNRLEAIYPESGFDVLFWDRKGVPESDALLSAMRKADLQVHLVSDILPGYEDFHAIHPEYQIAYDGHPSPPTYQLLSDYVVHEILKK